MKLPWVYMGGAGGGWGDRDGEYCDLILMEV